MVLSRPGSARVCWLWCVLVLLSLSGCSTPYHFRYQSAIVAPEEGSPAGIDNEQLRIRLVPTPEVGVLELMVMNKGAQPVTIVWPRTRYIDPLGQPRPALNAAPAGFFGPPGWPAEGTRIMPGEAFQTTIRPGGFRPARLPSLSPYAGQPDLRVPPDPEFQPSGRPAERVSLNPLTVSRSTGGEVAVSATPQPLLPTSGNTPSLGQAYKDREFRFILMLSLDTGLVPYTFTFRITDVEVQQGSG
jgi:hypothetical protein